MIWNEYYRDQNLLIVLNGIEMEEELLNSPDEPDLLIVLNGIEIVHFLHFNIP